MLMDYVGTLKTWLLWPVFLIWHPGVWSMRLPVCLVSVVTLLLFAWLVGRIADSEVAISAALLLAADASFVFTNVFDWGPVALLLVGALGFLALIIHFARSKSKIAVAAAFFLAGLMLWYKAIFAYPLAGILIASIAVFLHHVRGLITTRNILVVAGSLLVGMSPLIAFNFRTSGATLGASSYLVRTSAGEKFMMMYLTLNGKALEHYMVRSRLEEILPLHGAPLGELVESWYRRSTLGPGSFLSVALLVSAVALPFIRSSSLFRAIAFAWVAVLSTFGLFLASGTAGAGPHHTVLIYPAPQFIVAATFAALSERMRTSHRRILLFGVVTLVTASNLFLLAKYHRASLHNGFSVYWTDATQQLAVAIRTETRPVAFMDWGIEDPTRIQCGDVIQIAQPFPARRGVLYVTHTDDYRIVESETRRVLEDAASRGLAASVVRIIPDAQGHEILSLFSFRPLATGTK